MLEVRPPLSELALVSVDQQEEACPLDWVVPQLALEARRRQAVSEVSLHQEDSPEGRPQDLEDEVDRREARVSISDTGGLTLCASYALIF